MYGMIEWSGAMPQATVTESLRPSRQPGHAAPRAAPHADTTHRAHLKGAARPPMTSGHGGEDHRLLRAATTTHGGRVPQPPPHPRLAEAAPAGGPRRRAQSPRVSAPRWAPIVSGGGTECAAPRHGSLPSGPLAIPLPAPLTLPPSRPYSPILLGTPALGDVAVVTPEQDTRVEGLEDGSRRPPL